MRYAAVSCMLFALIGIAMAERDPICFLRPADKGVVGGSCQVFVSRWTYFHMTNDCRRFEFGGCKGNANRFESRKKCEDKCLKRS
ncbi:kunitz-type serine protease inhibitor-like [Drosophila hydei]|uniref:Kunitz-type serine protease inhibitor-like n=1 Tax=Drosophila hydei TaxID=7224 RepID=A0A6J1M442_DROHY|nr:kunitz-type serine protease inhibitor-like [Drosophila hydei]